MKLVVKVLNLAFLQHFFFDIPTNMTHPSIHSVHPLAVLFNPPHRPPVPPSNPHPSPARSPEWHLWRSSPDDACGKKSKGSKNGSRRRRRTNVSPKIYLTRNHHYRPIFRTHTSRGRGKGFSIHIHH